MPSLKSTISMPHRLTVNSLPKMRPEHALHVNSTTKYSSLELSPIASNSYRRFSQSSRADMATYGIKIQPLNAASVIFKISLTRLSVALL